MVKMMTKDGQSTALTTQKPIQITSANGTIKLRNYKDADYNSVIGVLKECELFAEYLDNRKSLQKKTKIFPGSIIVATTSKQIVGCVYALNEARSISHLAVTKRFRKKGIASMLLSEAENYLVANSIYEWTLFTLKDREDLHKYYTKRGYEKGAEFAIFTKRKVE